MARLIKSLADKKGALRRKSQIEPRLITGKLKEAFFAWSKDIPDELMVLGKPAKEVEQDELHGSLCRYIDTLNLVPKSSEELSVLDVGIGYGHLAFLLRELFHFRVSGIDIERQETKYLERRFKAEHIDFKLCDLTKDPLPFGNTSFDIVLFCEVLEHLLIPPKDVLSEINRVLKKGGFLILTTPNFATLHNRLSLLLGRNPQPPSVPSLRGWCKSEVGFGHIREYTASECVSLCNECGFRIDKIYFSNAWTKTMKERHSKVLIIMYFIASQIWGNLRDFIMIRAIKNK